MCVENMFTVGERRPHAVICLGPPFAVALAIIWFSLNLPEDGMPHRWASSQTLDPLRWIRPNTDTTWVPDEFRTLGFALCAFIWMFSFWITCFKIIAFTAAPSGMVFLAYVRAGLGNTCFAIIKMCMDLYSKSFKRSEGIFWINFVLTFSMLAMYLYAIFGWLWRGYRAFATRRLRRDEEADVDVEERKHLDKSPSSDNVCPVCTPFSFSILSRILPAWIGFTDGWKAYSLLQSPKQGDTAIETEKSTVDASY